MFKLQKNFYIINNMIRNLMILSFFVVIAGCAKNKAVSAVYDQKVNSEDLSSEQAYDLIKQKNTEYILLDVRTPREYNEGHIPGAVNIDFFSSNFNILLNNLDKTKKYIVYCKSGYRSGKAVREMENRGFKEIHNMVDGFDGWRNKNFPVEKEE